MKTKIIAVVLTLTIITMLVTACGGSSSDDFDKEVAVIVALTQTAMAMDNSAPASEPSVTEAAPTAVSGDYQPISEQACAELNALLSQSSGHAGVVTNPAPFNDYVNETAGWGCDLSFITNGADPDYNQLGIDIPAALTANGWMEDGNYTFPGIGGLVSAYRKGDQLCLTANYVEPSNETLCNEGENFLDCLRRLPPEQVRYGYDLTCAIPVP